MKKIITFFRKKASAALKAYTNLIFRKKIVIVYIIASFIPIAILVSVSWFLLHKDVQNQLSISVDDYLRTCAETVNDNLNRISAIVHVSGIEVSIKTALNDDNLSYYDIYELLTYYLEPYFGYVKASTPEINDIYVITDNSMLVNRSPTIVKKDSVIGRPWLQNALTEFSPAWMYDIAVKNNSLTEKPYYTLFCTKRILWNTNNKIQNIIYADIKFDKFFEILHPTQKDSGFYVVTNDYRIVYSTINGSIKLSQNELKNITNRADQSINAIGGKVYAASKSLSVNGLKLVYFTSAQNFKTSMNNLILLTVFIFFISLLATALLIFYSSKAIVGRLNSLKVKAEKIAQGDFSIELKSDANDEIGILTRIFDKMVSNINDLIDKVYKAEIKNREAEFKALQAQINPHFFYNVLSLINSMAIREHSYDISHLTTTISTYYRSMLSKIKNVIPIKSEIDNLKAYVEIQLMLNNHGFKVKYDIDDEVYQFTTFNLLLQPVVENAILHGLSVLESKNRLLEISAKKVNSEIVFIVKDNGVGISPDEIDEVLNKNAKGYGLYNVQNRIKYLYGTDYGIIINSMVNCYTEIVVTIPCVKI